MVKPIWNNAQRVNHQNFAKKTHPCAKKNMVQRAVLMKSGLVSVNTAHSKTTVNAAKPMLYLSKTAHLTVKRPIHKNTTFKNNNIDQRVNTIRDTNFNTARPKAVVNVVKGNNFNAVKASACWVWKPKHKVLGHGNPQIDYIDSGYSRHLTGNMSYLTDYEEIDGRYVAFGGNTKRGKITGKVIDESQVLLRVPRKNNMYSVDLKNIVPKGGLTCLFAKATSDESKLWHRRLGHLNFKTMNKLVKGNLVRGLPSKLFENDQTCVACQKGKQHRASFVTDDYSRFTWVFFLATKDETSGILKSFITGIENLVDHSVARTPQQNGVAERRNKTLIEAARTMLADSKLPTTFWAEAVNTACYVQNRVLVVKPHNKTPYELFHGRTPTLSFMRPFGCPVTILNTIDHLGKFDGKADEGFLWALGGTPNIVSSGPDWQFDIDALTRIMNYEPIVAGTQSNGFADPKSYHDDGSKPSSDGDKWLMKIQEKDSECKIRSVLFNTRIHKDHPLDQVIGDLQSATQTRKMSKNLEEHGFVSTIQQRTNHKDLQNCLFACFLSQEEPKKVIHALKDPSWIEAMQEELLQFKPHTQEEGIDYDEVFAPVARMEAIRLFLAYASFKDFVMYQMDVKNAFLYGKIEEEVYVCQPSGFEDPDFLDRVYKVRIYQKSQENSQKRASTV
ncbi:retrovirus-related pol polyprotein from transposon TNT 1-94, partial [Tanacetum coccineum]